MHDRRNQQVQDLVDFSVDETWCAGALENASVQDEDGTGSYTVTWRR